MLKLTIRRTTRLHNPLQRSRAKLAQPARLPPGSLRHACGKRVSRESRARQVDGFGPDVLLTDPANLAETVAEGSAGVLRSLRRRTLDV